MNSNNGPRYSIIGTFERGCGLFVVWKHIVVGIIQAIKNGYIPVIDIKHYPSHYFKEGKEFIDNVWEYYFEQPFGIGLDDIKGNANIYIQSCRGDKEYLIMPEMLPNTKKEKFDFKYIEYYKKFLKFNKDIQEYLDTSYNKIFAKTDGEGTETDVLGIMLRGTDYTQIKPAWHCIQPTVEQIIEKAEELYKKYNYKRVFVATEDLKIYNKFKKYFGDKLIENPQYKYELPDGKYISECGYKDRKDHFYNLGKEYILSIYLLSKCKYFIGGKANGTIPVYILSNYWQNYEYVYLFDLGRYKEKKKKSFLRKIFDISNSKDKIHKTVTILGIKVNFRKKK